MKPIFNLFSPNPDSIWHPDHYHKDIQEHILWPVKLFLMSFIAGTALLLVFRLTHFDMLLMAGFWYVVIAFFINSLAFICLLFAAALNYRHAMPLLLRALILLINIPIAFVYFNLVIH